MIPALRPLWMMLTGAVAAIVLSSTVTTPGGSALHLGFLGIGCGAAILAGARYRRGWVLWLMAGLCIGAARGLPNQEQARDLELLLADAREPCLRVKARLVEEWSPSQWGKRTTLQVSSARQQADEVSLPGRCRLEVRGPAPPKQLPPAGAEVNVLVSVRGPPRRPLLVASSWRLIEQTHPPGGLHHLRNLLANQLLNAAGTDVKRVRIAELAAALTVGRRDLLPPDRVEGWRASGLAHMLAVSGLHVGVVGGGLWLCALSLGLGPKLGRWLVLMALPSYALLSGASPSACRAAVMGMIYLLARLLGRPLLPLAAVLLTALLMVLYDPSLVADVGFQLTVCITAALIRWVPPLTAALPGPRWLVGIVALPLVAQLAAVPLVALHFHRVIPGALLANLLMPILMAPALSASLLALALAPVWSGGCILALDLVGLVERMIWFCGAFARSSSVCVAAPPIAILVLLTVTGWAALQGGRLGRYAATMWLCLLGIGALWHLREARLSPGTTVLLPVHSGAAVLCGAEQEMMLLDGGGFRRETAELLAEQGVHTLSLVLASHSDEDHIGGLAEVLNSCRVERLAFPTWMRTAPEVVPLLHQARRRGTLVIPACRGTALRLGTAVLEVLWPPAEHPPSRENERSLVLRLHTTTGTVLLPSDIGHDTEQLLADMSHLASEVLVAPHHGSRHSLSPTLLDNVSPQVVLIAASPGNSYGHPHQEVLDRLDERGINYRYPARDGLCGARPYGHTWRLFP